MNYSVAFNWDEKLLKGLSDLNLRSKNDKITEIFGSTAYSLFGSANAGLPEVQKNEIERKIKKAKKLGFRFNYLVNSIDYPKIKNQEVHEEAIEYFKWLESMGVDSVTIANEDILVFVTKHFPNLKINISIVRGVKTVEEANNLRAKYPNIQRIILNHTINRCKERLIDHVRGAKVPVGVSDTVEVELLANEICIFDCPRMEEHYTALTAIAQKQKINDFDWGLCGRARVKNVRYFLNSCWIRPEDVYIYQKLGIKMLKIAGRKESTENLLRRAKAYMNRRYKGNVMDLFLAEFWPNSRPPFINNRELDGYIDSLWKRGLERLKVKDEVSIRYSWK